MISVEPAEGPVPVHQRLAAPKRQKPRIFARGHRIYCVRSVLRKPRAENIATCKCHVACGLPHVRRPVVDRRGLLSGCLSVKAESPCLAVIVVASCGCFPSSVDPEGACRIQPARLAVGCHMAGRIGNAIRDSMVASGAPIPLVLPAAEPERIPCALSEISRLALGDADTYPFHGLARANGSQTRSGPRGSSRSETRSGRRQSVQSSGCGRFGGNENRLPVRRHAPDTGAKVSDGRNS